MHAPLCRGLVATALLGGLALSFSLTADPAPAEARVGGRPPAFTLPAVVGGPSRGRFRMADHLGEKPVIVLFWATWCVPCRQELPYYQSLYERYHAQGLEIVAISMDGPNTITQAGPAARRLGVTFPVVSDLDTRVTSQMNPRRSAPFSVMIDRSGRIVWEHEGFSPSEQATIGERVANLVGSGGPRRGRARD